MSFSGIPSLFVSIVLTAIYYAAVAMGGGIICGLFLGAVWAGIRLFPW